ncbi:MAG: hypothetical protein HC836_44245 [Richelia sp. RM2_1_2]|nr:hypothetical protein [Richelia sp. RM2_1_2]
MAQKDVSKFYSKDSTVKTKIQSIDNGSSKDVTNIGKKKCRKNNIVGTTSDMYISKDVHRKRKKTSH